MSRLAQGGLGGTDYWENNGAIDLGCTGLGQEPCQWAVTGPQQG